MCLIPLDPILECQNVSQLVLPEQQKNRTMNPVFYHQLSVAIVYTAGSDPAFTFVLIFMPTYFFLN